MAKKKKRVQREKRNYEHIAHQQNVTGVGRHKSPKDYTRKRKHKKGWDEYA